MDPIDIVSSSNGCGTDAGPSSYSVSSTIYGRSEDSRAVNWMHDKDRLGVTQKPEDTFCDFATSDSPSSSILQPSFVRHQSESTTSSRAENASGMHCRPEFPVSSALVWDLLQAQDNLLKPYDGPKMRPEGFRDFWTLPDNLAAFTPPILSAPNMLECSPVEAESIWEVLHRQGVIGARNHVNRAPNATKLEGVLQQSRIVFGELKLKKLEWIIGIFYDLNIFNIAQFEEIHQHVWPALWNSCTFVKHGGITAWFRDYPSPTSHKKYRNYDHKTYDKRLFYWRDEKIWQQAQWGSQVPQVTKPSISKLKALAAGLATPRQNLKASAPPSLGTTSELSALESLDGPANTFGK